MSAIPRLSKLPLPRSAAAPAPTSTSDENGRQSPPFDSALEHHQESLQSPVKQPSKTSLPARPARAIARPVSSYGGQKNDSSTSFVHLSKREAPTTGQSRIQPKRAPQHSGHGSRSSSDDIEGIARFKASKRPSQQENIYQSAESQDDSDGSTAPSSNEPTSPFRAPRKSRPSLSDRTMESLSHVPPSPATARRQSNFFNPQNPMTPSRPPATASAQSALPKINYGSVKSSMIKPSSPTKRATGIPPPTASTPARRAVSSGLPTTGGLRNPTPTTVKRSSMYVKGAPTKTPSSSLTGKSGLAKPAHARSATVDHSAPSLASGGPGAEVRNRPKPSGSVTGGRPKTVAPKNTPVAALVEDDVMASSRRISTSSAALRAQIAQAKAAARVATSQRSATPLDSDGLGYDFVNCEDPFNQKPKDGKDVLRKRINSARQDGRLNISAMTLKEIPDEVLHMYSSEALEENEISWSDVKDLTKFNAADNELEKIPDSVFPDDNSTDASDQGDNVVGSQFGGLEVIDLHGNQLKTIPSGFRCLQRLTTLNLSRNNLDNSVFDIVSQIVTLRSLDLSCNDLVRDLPTNIAELGQLEDLDLHGNRLSSLPSTPSTWKSLTKLRILNISTNRLSLLPIDVLVNLPSLIELHARNNALTGALFPLNMTCVPKLQVLDVANNSIASLSFLPTLDFPSLVRLDVSANRMPLLPDMTTWTNLKSLLAEENGLDALPTGFTKMSNLRSANLRGNSIRMLEPEVGYMDKLESLIIDGNPMIRDKKFLTMGTEDVKRELRRRAEVPASVPTAGVSSS